MLSLFLSVSVLLLFLLVSSGALTMIFNAIIDLIFYQKPKEKVIPPKRIPTTSEIRRANAIIKNMKPAIQPNIEIPRVVQRPTKHEFEILKETIEKRNPKPKKEPAYPKWFPSLPPNKNLAIKPSGFCYAPVPYGYNNVNNYAFKNPQPSEPEASKSK